MEPVGMRGRSEPLEARKREEADAEWAGTFPSLEAALRTIGIVAAVESHPAAEILKPDAMGRKISGCPPHQDWIVISLKPMSNGSMAVAAPMLREAGAVEYASRTEHYFYYEQHILECCSFSRNLLSVLKKGGIK